MALTEAQRIDYLKRLELPPEASDEDVRAAWRRLAFERHPDRGGSGVEDFARIRKAYEALRAAPARPRSVLRSRPRVEERVRDLPEDVLDLCRSVLRESARRAIEDTSRTVVAEHVPTAVAHRGRQLSYIVRTPLGEGLNRIALPTGELEDNRGPRAKVVELAAKRAGWGLINVPETIRERLFPGARSVSIRFAQA